MCYRLAVDAQKLGQLLVAVAHHFVAISGQTHQQSGLWRLLNLNLLVRAEKGFEGIARHSPVSRSSLTLAYLKARIQADLPADRTALVLMDFPGNKPDRSIHRWVRRKHLSHRLAARLGQSRQPRAEGKDESQRRPVATLRHSSNSGWLRSALLSEVVFFYNRIQAPEFDGGIGSGEVPYDLTARFMATLLPGCDLTCERAHIWDRSVQALPFEN
jgi:hypothetical protein